MHDGVRLESAHLDSKTSASSVIIDSARHSGVPQSATHSPEGSDIGTTKARTNKNRKRRNCFATFLERLWISFSKDRKPSDTLDSHTTPRDERRMRETTANGSKVPATPLEPSKRALEPRPAESHVSNSNSTGTKEPLPSYSSSAPHKQQKEPLGRPSETDQVLPSQAVLQHDLAEQATSQESVNPFEPDVYTAGIEDSRGQLLRIAPERSQNDSSVDQSSKFKTQFNMVIHPSQNRIGTRVAKLDTASKVNVLSEDVVNELGMTMEPYLGRDVFPIGKPVRPMGTVRLEWHIMKRTKTYNTEFLVFNSDLSKDFDVLLSEGEIARIGFYRKNSDVWFLDTTGKERAFLPTVLIQK